MTSHQAPHRVFNFSPGPAALPTEVLEKAAAEMLDWRGMGVSVMEVSHRGKDFMEVAAKASHDFRSLLKIPEDYAVLFMQGGAIGENGIVPLNLMLPQGKANYLITGQWSTRSAKEASRYGQVQIVANGADAKGRYQRLPTRSDWQIDPEGAYFHLCVNETIDGLAFDGLIDRGDAPFQAPAAMPVVADVSSTILSEALDVSQFGVLYGGAQKNIGPAGLTFVIVRKDLLGRTHPLCPSAFNYQIVAENDSMYNTPPTYSIYLAGLVFEWLIAQGGVESIAKVNAQKARLLYDTIDQTDFYYNLVEPAYRSKMNVCFFLRDETLNTQFLKESQASGLLALKGHRLVGGMRASIYNAMPLAGVEALVAFMKAFEKRYG
ncbi:MAG: 3-phosphoserine/phosphohydroxythreonine transaminase [Pseudomonadota bacterium]